MPSQRRVRTTVVLAVTAVLVLFYVTTGQSSTKSSAFYTRTVAALDARHRANQAVLDDKGSARIYGHEDEEEEDSPSNVRASRSRSRTGGSPRGGPDSTIDKPSGPKDAISGVDVEDLEREAAKGSDSGSGIRDAGILREQPVLAKPHEGTGPNNVVGGKIVKIPSDADRPHADAARAADGVAKIGNTGKQIKDKQNAFKDPEAAADDDVSHAIGDASARKGGGKAGARDDVDSTKQHGHGDDDDDEASHDKIEAEIDSILKRSPIIVFSKTYCRFSKNAKRILLQQYKIVPAPYVVELDTHPKGDELQAAIYKITGRRTVPNVLVNGKSIGGSDELDALEAKGQLRDELISLGGKRLMDVTKA